MRRIAPAPYHRRKWPVYVMSGLSVFFVLGMIFWPFIEQALTPHYTPDDTVVPNVQETPVVVQPSPTVGETTSPAPEPVIIDPSAPRVLYLPNKDKQYEVRTKQLLPLKCGKDIPYPDSGPDMWKGFYCTDRGLPGTNTPYYGIITGHSTNYGETVMNSFYKQGKKLVGQRVYIKTAKSGNRWLVYQFTAVYKIDKDKLGGATQVWGDKKTSTAGRIIFLTCQQIAPGVNSVQNFVGVAEFVGVVDDV